MVTIREEVSEAIVASASRGEIDIVIDVLPFDQNHLNIETLFIDEFYVAVHQSNPLASLDEIPIDALKDTPFILLEDIHCLARQIENYCFNKRYVPKVMFQASQLATVKQLIELQYGISLLPAISIDVSSDSPVRYIKLQGEKPSREVVLATARDRYFSPASEYFLSAVKRQFQTA